MALDAALGQRHAGHASTGRAAEDSVLIQLPSAAAADPSSQGFFSP
jgi:hypothetical protein